MKEQLKKLLPESMIINLRKKMKPYHRNRQFKKLYDFDKKRYKKYSYEFSNEMDFDNLRSKITFHYHSIEKGLSNSRFRGGFGKTAFTELFFAMDKYLEKGYPTDDARFQQAISTITAYVNRHNEINIGVPEVSKKLESYLKYDTGRIENVGGATIKEKSSTEDYAELNFKDLALNRHSIRDFGSARFPEECLVDAIEIANKTPSVCNRQSTHVYYIKDSAKMEQIFNLQGGLTTHGENLQGILLVTANRKYMNGPHERNQTYIDGGLYLMSLVYALTYKNIATCVLNANFTLEKELESRKILGISEAEDLIAFVAVGTYPENIRYANSPRDTAEDVFSII